MNRVEHEGLSFIMITLPQFGKDLQKALAEGKVGPDLFIGYPKRGKLPLFLSGFLSQVFDVSDGTLLDVGRSALAMQAIFQVTGLTAKVKMKCADKRIDSAFANYIENERQVREFDESIGEGELARFRMYAHLIYGDLFRSWENQVKNGEIVPSHGPGSVADKLFGNEKWNQPEWPDRLEHVFPFGRYAYPSWHLYLSDMDDRDWSSLPGAEMPVRVITVPKTMKTPRIIAIEPTAMQYMQQGLMRAFEKSVRTAKYGGLINYKSQLPNQEMARKGSITGALATLDLSDASDRVSNQLVRAMLRDFPVLLEAIDATRSRMADVPGFGVIRLAKFASMGSALCFPIESLVFSIVSIMAYHDFWYDRTMPSKPPTFDVWMNTHVKGKVRTYGDDIIVPTECALSVIERLEAYGFKVNRTKSFWTGKFRESCGKEYFDGFDVTYAKCRMELPSYQMRKPERAAAIVSASALRNNLYDYGYFDTLRN